MFRPLVVAAMAGLALAGPPAAAKSLGSFGAWEAHSGSETGGRFCYAVSQPVQRGDYESRRGLPSLQVTHRPTVHMRNQVEFRAGFEIDAGAGVRIGVDGGSFPLAAYASWATAEAGQRRDLVRALKAGGQARVTTTAWNGDRVVDRFELDGFARAYAAITEACAIDPEFRVD